MNTVRPTRPTTFYMVSSVRVTVLGGHEHVEVWTRGAKAGTLIVGPHEGQAFAHRLLAPSLDPDEKIVAEHVAGESSTTFYPSGLAR